jgi:hypothetical protein
MVMTRTPPAITDQILDLCREINPEKTPQYLRILPDRDCAPLDCFHNARRRVERDGGSIQFGWAIWEWPGVYIEAEHHAVYVPLGQPWVDLTPSATPGFSHRLFLADDAAIYNFKNEGIRRDNHRRALRDDALIQDFFHVAIEHNRIMSSIPGIGEVSVDLRTAQKLEALQQKRDVLTYQIAMKYTPRNSRCFCDSGRKFKHCHGRS